MAVGHSRRSAQGFANVLFDAMARRLPAFKSIMEKKEKTEKYRNKNIKIKKQKRNIASHSLSRRLRVRRKLPAQAPPLTCVPADEAAERVRKKSKKGEKNV
ncbi:hypothetical protein [Acetobacter fabarum]|uniref:hypothetical protein n=1 Tax=Acetobacter fabarum TaxID=483199 RepID=UPI0039EBCEF7